MIWLALLLGDCLCRHYKFGKFGRSLLFFVEKVLGNQASEEIVVEQNEISNFPEEDEDNQINDKETVESIANDEAMSAPMKLRIFGSVFGFGIIVSVPYAIAFGVFIAYFDGENASSHRFVKNSLLGPPASIDPSYMKLTVNWL